MEEIDFGEIQQVLDEILGNGTDFQQMVGQLSLIHISEPTRPY